MSYLQIACALLGADLAQAYNARVEGDEFVVLINRGIKGGQKYRLPLAHLVEPEPQPETQPAPDATDAARVLAMEHGVDLRTIAGSGWSGRIIMADVRTALEVHND